MQLRGNKDFLPRPVYSPRDIIFDKDFNGYDFVKNASKISIEDKEDVINKVRKAKDGARFYCHVNWKDSKGGHEFLLLNINDEVYLADAQSNVLVKVEDDKEYFDDINFDNSFIVRIDDKQINENILKYNDDDYIIEWNDELDMPLLEEYTNELKQIKTPKQLLKFMSDNLNYYLDEEEYNDESEVLTQTPDELLRSKKGHCAEQSYLEKEVLDDLGYDTQLWFVKENNSKDDYGIEGSAHVFLTYEDNGDIVWFENAMEHMRGIHKYNSEEKLLDAVADNWWKYDKDSDILEFRKLSKPITHINNYELAKECHKAKLYDTRDISHNVMEDEMITESYNLLMNNRKYLIETKEDIEKFKDKFGEETYQLYLKSKDRLKNNGYSTDIIYYTQKVTKEELEDLLSKLQRRLSTKKDSGSVSEDSIRGVYKYLGSKDGYKVYQPLDYVSSMDLSYNTGWCTGGRYGHAFEPNFKPSMRAAKDHFLDYASKGITLYYFLDSKTMEGKYAIALYPDVFEVNEMIENHYVIETNFELYNQEDEIDYSALNKIPYELIPEGLVIDEADYENGLYIKDNILLKADEYIKEVIIPNNITRIDESAFYHCSNLTNIFIPNNVTSIGDDAFYDCYRLKNITISNNVESIGNSAFSYCKNLEHVYYQGTKEEWNSIEIGVNNEYLLNATIHYNDKLSENLKIKVNDNTKLKYMTENGDYDQMKDKYKFIGENDKYKIYEALDPKEYKKDYGSDSKTAYYFIQKSSNTLKYKMIMFQTTHFPVHQVLGDCYISKANFHLTDADYNNCFYALSEIPFELIPDIDFIASPNRVSNGLYIDNNVLIRADKNIREVIIPNIVKSIGEQAFYDCSKLTSISIPSSVKSIGDSAFSCCSSLPNVIIPNTVTTIGAGAFGACISLTNISIPNTITKIDSHTFAYCSKLRTITLPDSITSIGYGAFEDCYQLPSVSIPNNVRYISYKAFSGCNHLKHVYYQGSQEDWNLIKIESDGNKRLLNANIHYNSKMI